MSADPRPFVVTRCRHIAPKERRIERAKSEYSVWEFKDDRQGRYWFVVATFEVKRIGKAS